MNKLHLILGILISIGIIYGAVYRFDICKASRSSVVELKADFSIYKLEQYRRYLQERIWQLQRENPQTYTNLGEYKRLVEELRMIDIKIKSYYKFRKG